MTRRPPAPFDLVGADQHIAEMNRRITRLSQRIREEKADGHDTGQAEALMRTFREALRLGEEHRRSIVKALMLGEAAAGAS